MASHATTSNTVPASEGRLQGAYSSTGIGSWYDRPCQNWRILRSMRAFLERKEIPSTVLKITAQDSQDHMDTEHRYPWKILRKPCQRCTVPHQMLSPTERQTRYPALPLHYMQRQSKPDFFQILWPYTKLYLRLQLTQLLCFLKV